MYIQVPLSAQFLKYGNKTDRPPEAVYAISCGAYTSGGFNERSTKLNQEGASSLIVFLDEFLQHNPTKHSAIYRLCLDGGAVFGELWQWCLLVQVNVLT